MKTLVMAAGWPRWSPRALAAAWPQQVAPPTASPSTARCSRTATRPSCSRPRARRCGRRKRGPEERLARALRPGQGPGRGQGRLRRSCRATSPTPSQVQDLESRLVHLHGDAAGASMRAEIAKTAVRRAASRPTIEALAAWVSAESRGLRINLPQSHAEGSARATRLGKRAFFFRGGPHDFSCASLPRRGRQAHPAAGPAQPDEEPRRRHRLRGLAGLPGVAAARCGACSGG